MHKIDELKEKFNSDKKYSMDEKLYAAKIKSIPKIYGFYWPHDQREEKKKAATEILNQKQPLDIRCHAAIMFISALFMRSVESWVLQGTERNPYLEEEHPDFRHYAAMIIAQPHWKDVFSPDVYESLVREYGQLPGMEVAGTFYSDDNTYYLNQKKESA